MSEALPIGDFTFLADDEVASFNLDATTKSDDYGYILDDSESEHRHDSHSDYPLAAGRFPVDNERNVICIFILPDQQTSDFWKIIFKPIWLNQVRRTLWKPSTLNKTRAPTG